MAVANGLVLGRYVRGTSCLHNLDPRAKLIAALSLVSAAAFLRSGVAQSVLMAFLLTVISRSPLSVGLILRHLRAVTWLFVMTILFHLLFSPVRGGPFWTGVYATPEAGWSELTTRLGHGLVFCGRIAVMVLSSSLLMLTTAPLDLAEGIEEILLPLRRFRVPAHEIGFVLMMSLSFVPLLLEEAQRITKAQMARGARFGGGLVARARRFLPLFVPLLVGAWRRAGEVSLALEARHYRGGEGRTRIRQLRCYSRDWAAVAVTIGIVVIAFWAGRLSGVRG